MNWPGLTCSLCELCPQPNYMLFEKTSPYFSFALNLLFAVFLSFCHFFHWDWSILRLPWLHRPLLSLTSAIFFTEWQILAAEQSLVYDFNYPLCSSLRLFQLFCTLFEMTGPQQHAMCKVWEQAIDVHSSIMMLSVLLFIPFLEIPSTVWICFSCHYWWN